MHIKKVTTNVKGEIAADMGPLTLVVGKNGSHKSGLVTAVELALTGRCTAGGAVASKLMALAAPRGSKSLFVHADISGDGPPVGFSVKGSTARASKPVWLTEGYPQPVGAMLMTEVADVLSSEPKRLRQALLKAACGEVDGAAVAAAVPQAFHEEWRRIWHDAVAESETAADALVLAAEKIRKEVRETRSEVRSFDEPVPEPVSQDEIDKLRDELKSARAGVPKPSDSPEMAKIRQVKRVVEAAVEILEFASTAEVAGCPVCENELSSEQVIDSLTKNRARVERINERMQRVLQAGVDVERSVDEIESRLLALLSKQAMAASWEQRKAEALRAEGRVDVLKALAAAVDRAVGAELESKIDAFAAVASEGLARGKIEIQLFDKGKPVCNVGWRDSFGDYTQWWALSGAERVQCLSAFAYAWAKGSGAPVKVIVVDDVWLDADQLELLCAGLRNVVGKPNGPTQAIVCAVTDYGKTLDDWMVVRC